MDAHESQYCWDGLEQFIPALRKELERRSRRSDEVDDLLQETLLRAARFRRRLRDPRNLRGWLRQIARSVLSERLRTQSRQPPVAGSDGVLELLPSREYEPGTRSLDESITICGRPVLRDELFEQLHEALYQLRGSDQRLLSERYGLASVCEAEPRACARGKDHMFRARKRVLKRLHEQLPRLLESADRETFVEDNT